MRLVSEGRANGHAQHIRREFATPPQSGGMRHCLWLHFAAIGTREHLIGLPCIAATGQHCAGARPFGSVFAPFWTTPCRSSSSFRIG
eukprot:425128-Pleurochrysis_carterae.AAC.5